jgi:integrase
MAVTGSKPRRGWRERVESGIYRQHRVGCASSADQRPGRRCGCPLHIAVPGDGGSTLEALDAGETLTDARRRRRVALAAGPRARPAGDPRPQTVRDLARAFLRARAPLLAPATVRTLEEGFRDALPVIGGVELDRLSRDRAEALVAALLAAGRSPHATRKALAALRPACTFAVERGWLDANPCARVRVPEPPRDPGELAPVERVLTADELERLYRHAAGVRDEVVLRLAGDAGLRSGEVRGLAWPDVDLAARRLHVRRSLWRREDPKLPKSRRARRVAISPELADALSRLYALEVVERGLDANGYVLVGRDGARAVCESYGLAVAARAQRAAGLVVERNGKRHPRITFHELRHTRASLALRDRVDLVTVARQLGHAGPHITATVYAHLVDDGALDAVATAGRTDRGSAVGASIGGELAAGR